ncbi:hypothetical protein KAU11_10505 [Candidatus Babeliales bacterium]|nr:hypothetical protein [Candidatus Babeliales bacterium]
MKILYINELGIVHITPEAARIREFKAIFEGDQSRGKDSALDSLAFVYYTGSVHPSNPLRGLNKEDKLKEAISMFPEVDITSPLIKDAIVRFRRFEETESVALKYVRTTIQSMDKLKNFLDEVDLNEKDDNGKLVYNAKQYIDSLSNTSNLIKSLSDLEKQVMNDEISREGELRGNGEDEVDFGDVIKEF